MKNTIGNETGGLSRKYRKTFQRNSDALFYPSCAHPDETLVPLIGKAFSNGQQKLSKPWTTNSAMMASSGSRMPISCADMFRSGLRASSQMIGISPNTRQVFNNETSFEFDLP
jgi:hypothetical protein